MPQDNKILSMTNNIIRMVAMDCDGTLFSKHGRISEYGASVLKQLKERGILVVICTGRPLYSIQRALSSDLYDYAVLNNGMQSAKNNGEIIEDKRKLLPEEIREITRCCERFNVMMSVSYDDDFHHFTSKKHHLYVSSVQKLKNLARKMLGRKLWSDDMHSDYEKLTSYQIDKICFSGTNAALQKLSQSLDHAKYSVLFVSSNWLEIMPYGVSKGAALLKIMELEKITKEECAAFGDGENDLSMLEAAGCPVAMKNAMPSLKEAAAYVTEEHCADDGCAKWIDTHILQNHG